jgi:Ca2+-binding RTX toxin-like protein
MDGDRGYVVGIVSTQVAVDVAPHATQLEEWIRGNDHLIASIRYQSPSDVVSRADGAAMYREVASDDDILSHARDTWRYFDAGATAQGTAGRDVMILSEDNQHLTHVAGGGGDDVYIVRWVPGRLTGGDPRIIEASDGGEDSVWVSQSDYILPNSVENLVSMTERGVRMLANDGSNKFIGGPGGDMLFSGYGDDIVYGREGDDLIIAGHGTDVMFGCEGNDTFAWERDHLGGGDRIMDWNAGDRLDLQGIGGRFLTMQRAADVELWHDADGNGAPDQLVVTVIAATADQVSGALFV